MTNKNQKDRIRAYMARHAVNYTTARRAVLNSASQDTVSTMPEGTIQSMPTPLTRPAATLAAEALSSNATAPTGTSTLAASAANDIDRRRPDRGFTAALGARDLTVLATLHAVFWTVLMFALASTYPEIIAMVMASPPPADTAAGPIEAVIAALASAITLVIALSAGMRWVDRQTPADQPLRAEAGMTGAVTV